MEWQWNEKLETGIEPIDQQHKQLIEQTNAFIEACQKGEGKECVSNTLEFLEQYTRKHFQNEENIQKNWEYPDYEIHKQYHKEFIEQLEQLKKEFELEGATPGITLDLSRAMMEWLVTHIDMEDRKLGEFIKNKSEE